MFLTALGVYVLYLSMTLVCVDSEDEDVQWLQPVAPCVTLLQLQHGVARYVHSVVQESGVRRQSALHQRGCLLAQFTVLSFSLLSDLLELVLCRYGA